MPDQEYENVKKFEDIKAAESRLFKKSLIGCFICVDTRLAFDSETLLEDKKNEKVLLDLNIDGQRQTKRISSKILKMDENNQYSMAMTKPLPYRCIKKKENPPIMTEFHRILNNLSHEDSVGHTFIVDIKFHNVNPKTMLFNELYLPMFKKDKKMEPFERFTLQLLSTIVIDENTDKKSHIRYNSKNHSTLREKKLISLYAEDLHFLITRTGWLVTHI